MAEYLSTPLSVSDRLIFKIVKTLSIFSYKSLTEHCHFAFHFDLVGRSHNFSNRAHICLSGPAWWPSDM